MAPIDEPTHEPTDPFADEEEFRREMRAAGATVSSWANGPGDRYGVHSHPYRKVLWCVDGSIVFHLPEADVELTAGSRVVIGPGTDHSAEVGSAGVRCAEAQFRAEVEFH